MAVISKDITLSYQAGATGEYTPLTNLQEIPELNGSTDAIEITTLAHAAHMYTNGIKNYGDSIDFKFLYEPDQFLMLNGATGVNGWKVALPDGTTCTFSGVCSVKLDGVGINTALTYTLSIKPQSEMEWA